MTKVFQFQLSDPEGIRKGLKEIFAELRRSQIKSEQQGELDELAATLKMAAIAGDQEIFIPLTKTGGSKPRPEPSLLPWAVLDGHAEIVDALLKAGADPNEAVGDLPVLTMAADRGNTKIIRRLLDAGAVASPPKSMIDPLTMAVKCQREEAVDLLILRLSRP
jgi:hypothetical protein